MTRKKIIRVKIKTVGYLNLKTLQFFKSKAEFLISIEKAKLKQFNKKVSIESKAFLKICLLELKLQKAKLIKGYSWRKSCLLASCKNAIRKVKFSLSKDSRELLFS
jgi:cystathionine beta-lyase family protein involved in aluminum resistance